MQWKFNVIVVILVIASEPGCQASKAATSRFTIEELLTTTFPYSDPRTDSQLDMDPCKAGKNFEVLHSSNACSRKSFQKVFKNCLHKNNLRCQANLFLSSCFASLKTLQLRLKLSHSNRSSSCPDESVKRGVSNNFILIGIKISVITETFVLNN